MPYEALDLKTSDGETIKAFSILQDPNDPNYTNKTVLVLCPNAGNMGHFLPVAQYIYASFHYNVFMYSYRGYGHSTGKPSEIGLKIDADTVAAYIRSHKQLSNSSIIPYGRSLGGAVAIYITAKYPELISGLILENTFLNLPGVIPHLFPFLGPFKYLCHQIWNSEHEITSIPSHIPVMFFSGLDDEIVPPSHMKKLFDLSTSTSKQWLDFEGAHHNDTIVQPGYWEAFHKFCLTQVNPLGK
ncbi:unnamed protein product [Ambrosiozyma monospora]|uniref:Unnamed protein product n=1 Tax=Ambrosiozyma monospora TaxID=43982 RepID=A0A9W6YWD2_AMBMO|nr:unnamed protein product [Ambrosiozyma monospora]